jgi:hypothetical protein
VCFGDQPRQLAEDVGKSGKAKDSLHPGIDVAIPDWRFGYVIENKALAREPLHKLGGYLKMPGVHQNIVDTIEFFQDGDSM